MLKIENNFKLPSEFAAKGDEKILAQAIHVYQDRSHFGVAKVKGRGEVSRTTKKLYKQKGTGGARHGARSAPVFVGGGVTFGPRVAKRTLKLSDAIKKTTLKTALNLKDKEGKVFVVSGISTLKKTSEIADILKKIDAKAKKFVVALAHENMDKIRFARNIAGVEVLPYLGLNAFKATFGGTLVLDSEIFKKAESEKKEVKKEAKVKVAKTIKKVAKKGTKK